MTIFVLRVKECRNDIYIAARGNPVGRLLVEVPSRGYGDSFATSSQPTIYGDKTRAMVARDLAHHRLAGFVVEVVTFEEARS